MKNFRKIALALSLGLSIVAVPKQASAQFATVDFPHIGIQLTEFAQKAREWVQTVQSYQVVRDAYAVATTAKDISGRIRDISDQVKDLTSDGLALQRQIRDELKQVQNIRNLRVSNMQDVKNIASNISTMRLGNLFPSLGQSRRFTNALASSRDQDAATIKDIFNTVSTETGTRRNVNQSEEQKAEAAVTMLAVENGNQQEKIATAFRYKKTADELTAQAIELQDGTNTQNKFTMTDGERLLVQSKAADNMVKAQELRLQADALLASATQKGPAQLATENVMKEQTFVAGLQGIIEQQHSNF